MWPCWNHFFYLDGRMVHGRTRSYRLGVWDRYEGTPTEEGVLHAGRETGPKQFDLTSSSLAEGAVCFGNCLFIQWCPDSCVVAHTRGNSAYLTNQGTTQEAGQPCV